MKRVIVLILAVLCISLSPTLANRQAASHRLPSIFHVAQDLQRGMWIQGAVESPQTMAQFSASGQATFMSALKAGQIYTTGVYDWRIDQSDDSPLLVLYSRPDRREYRFSLSKTHQGMELTDLSTGHRQAFAFRPADSALQELNRSYLMGKWERHLNEVQLVHKRSIGDQPALTLKGATLRFDFRADGSFTRLLQGRSGEPRFEETGSWEVSKDGLQLLLHFPDPDGGRFTQCIRIKHLELDELVLAQPLAVVGQSMSVAEEGDVYLNKQ